MRELSLVCDPYLGNADIRKESKAQTLLLRLADALREKTIDYNGQANIFKQMYKLGYDRFYDNSGLVIFDSSGEVVK